MNIILKKAITKLVPCIIPIMLSNKKKSIVIICVLLIVAVIYYYFTIKFFNPDKIKKPYNKIIIFKSKPHTNILYWLPNDTVNPDNITNILDLKSQSDKIGLCKSDEDGITKAKINFNDEDKFFYKIINKNNNLSNTFSFVLNK